jgi:hypothetical protein
MERQFQATTTEEFKRRDSYGFPTYRCRGSERQTDRRKIDTSKNASATSAATTEYRTAAADKVINQSRHFRFWQILLQKSAVTDGCRSAIR